MGPVGKALWFIEAHLKGDASLAAVTLGGNYNAADQGLMLLRIWREIVLADLPAV